MDVRKAVILAAGLGTRFLPATKAMPKEMIPVVDKPTIQYIVEEIVASGIKQIIIVTGAGKRAIEDHFDCSWELEYFLADKGKKEELKEIRRISKMADFVYVRQHRDPQKYGIGPALFTVRHLIGNEPFVVSFGDDIISAKVPVTRSLIETYQKQGGAVVAVQKVAPEKVSRYGIIDGQDINKQVKKVKKIVEKPEPAVAPSNLAVTGRYILRPSVFEAIKETRPGKGGEVYLTDVLNNLIKHETVFSYQYQGRYYDTGNKTEFIKTTIDFALERPEMREDLKKFIKDKYEETNGGK